MIEVRLPSWEPCLNLTEYSIAYHYLALGHLTKIRPSHLATLPQNLFHQSIENLLKRRNAKF